MMVVAKESKLIYYVILGSEVGDDAIRIGTELKQYYLFEEGDIGK
jgi:hypothetical protein